MKTKCKSIVCISMSILLIVCCFFGCTTKQEEPTTTQTSTTQKEGSVVISNEVISDVDKTLRDIKDNKDLSTNEPVSGSESSELSIETEEGVESDAVVEQENISYDGTNSGNGKKLLGKYQGLTYYNQGDSRWANRPYTSSGNRSQTIKSSGCGPTSAAMVISSSKGAILPTTTANLFVSNGYRTKNNGTAWACWSFVADYFGFKEYHTTTNFNKALSYLKTDKDKNGISDYFVVVSVNSGLWTTGGHYIVLIGHSGNTITVYDPYLYAGKYKTASRKAAKVKVVGNSAYVSEASFKKYSNAVKYWIFSNDQTGKAPKVTKVNYVRYVATSESVLNVRNTYSNSGKIVGTVKKGEKVKVSAICNGYSQIGSNRWVSSKYLTSTNPNAKPAKKPAAKPKYITEVGKTYKFAKDTVLYSKSNLSGTKYQYKKGTSAKVKKHISEKVDYVLIPATGRSAYIKSSDLKANSSTKSKKKSTVGKTKTLKSDRTLYSKSNLSGTKYQYKKGTTVTILKNVSSKVDKVKVKTTGRVAYIDSTKSYK